MAGPASGSGGTITKDSVVVADIRKYSVSRKSDNKPYVSSSTAGQTKRLEGNKDWEATVDLYVQDGDIASIDLEEGDKIEIVFGSGAYTLTGNGIVDSVDVDVDVETADPIGASVSISADGALA